jgi:hypothetical protein
MRLCTTLPALLLTATLCHAQLSDPPISRTDLSDSIDNALRTADWATHLEFLKASIFDAAEPLSAVKRNSRYDRLLADDVMSLALAQAAMIRHVTPATLALVSVKKDQQALLEWLFQNRSAMESFLSSAKPEDNLPTVFKLWSSLRDSNPTDFDSYHNLALACALVFDRPVRLHTPDDPYNDQVDMLERYTYFLESDKQNKLKTSIPKLPAWALVWTVDAPVPTSELIWARGHIKCHRRKWDGTYNMVKYRMEKITKNKTIHEDYTLKEILKEGGICVDQAYFGAITAKANGIPAMSFTGLGQRGAHAWFGYMSADDEWNMSAGRYAADKFATGYTVDPQTGMRIKEHSLAILTDKQRYSPKYLKASRLTWLAAVLLDEGHPEKFETCLLLALATCSRHLEAWEWYVSHLKQVKAPETKWRAVLKDMRRIFKDYPDIIARTNELETEMLLAFQKPAEAAKALRRRTRKLDLNDKNRTDLILPQIREQARILNDAGDTEAAAKVYEKAIKDYGADVHMFLSLSTDYFAFASESGTRSKAIRKIESAMKRHHPLSSGDYFSMRTQAALLDMIAAFYRADDQDSKAERFFKKADKLRKQAADLSRWQQ